MCFHPKWLVLCLVLYSNNVLGLFASQMNFSPFLQMAWRFVPMLSRYIFIIYPRGKEYTNFQFIY